MRGIKYISLYEPSGYGTAAWRYLKGLKKSGIPLTWTPMVPGRGWGMGYEPFGGEGVGEPEIGSLCNRKIEYDTVIVHTVPEYYPLWKRREPDKRMIGYTVWETDRIPDHWPPLLATMDHLLVPCRWNKEVFKKCGVTAPIDVIPHIARDGRPPERDPFMNIPQDHYVFYTVGTWTVRKALWNTIRCYLDTFKKDDPTVLMVKTTERDFTGLFFKRFYGRTPWSLRKILWGYKKPARIKLVTEELSEEGMLRLHGRGDCYVSLCRSEGWGLGAFDAAGFGKPVIITGFGGQVDYLPREFAFLVDYKLIPVKDRLGAKSYSENQHWAEPVLRHGSQLMRRVFENPEVAGAMGKRLQCYVKERFHESVVIQKMLSILRSGLQSDKER